MQTQKIKILKVADLIKSKMNLIIKMWKYIKLLEN